MTQETRQRLFRASHALDSGMVRVFLLAIVAVYLIAPILIPRPHAADSPASFSPTKGGAPATRRL